MFVFEDVQNGVMNTIILSQVAFIQKNTERKMYRIYLTDGNYVDLPWDLRFDFSRAIQKSV